ncbi:MAG: potA 2 [Verrucomicrobiaceae bacterium]|nr:potA 2 [Verrucomicrobiaceae bacterium]
MVTITIQNLTKRFAGTTVLSAIDLVIEQGELFFLLGPSGCGKTTLLRSIAGFHQPDSGAILFDGRDITRVPPHLREAAMMFQSYALWPHLSVAENIAFGLEERNCSRPEIDHRVKEALEMVALEGLGARRIQQLSGGQQQRVALARALVIRPKVFLLDEPLSNLDTRLRIEMRAEIRRICKEFGLTGIYVTHDREEAMSMGDRLAIMDGGKVIQVGHPIEVYRNPINRMAAEFMGETNIFEGTLLRDTSRVGLFDIETPFGILRGRPFDHTFVPVKGQPVLLSVRPEALTFLPLRDTPNTFVGHITDTTYLGPTVHYEIQGSNGVHLKVHEMNPHLIRHPGEQEVRVNASTHDVLILRR